MKQHILPVKQVLNENM